MPKTDQSNKVSKPKKIGPRIVKNRGEPTKKKACTNCAKLKIKCDKAPGACGGCVKRNTTHSCSNEMRSVYGANVAHDTPAAEEADPAIGQLDDDPLYDPLSVMAQSLDLFSPFSRL